MSGWTDALRHFEEKAALLDADAGPAALGHKGGQSQPAGARPTTADPTPAPAPAAKTLHRAPGAAYGYRTLFDAGGFAQIPWLVQGSPALSPVAKVTYGLLIRAAWENPGSLITQKSLAAHTPCSLRTTQRALDELQQIGLVTVHRNGLMQPNLIVFEELCDELAARLGVPMPEEQP